MPGPVRSHHPLTTWQPTWSSMAAVTGLSSGRTALLTKDDRVDLGQPHQVFKACRWQKGEQKDWGTTEGTPHTGAGLGTGTATGETGEEPPGAGVTVPPPPKPDRANGQPEGAPNKACGPLPFSRTLPGAESQLAAAALGLLRLWSLVGQQQEERTDAGPGSGEQPGPARGGRSLSTGFISRAHPPHPRLYIRLLCSPALQIPDSPRDGNRSSKGGKPNPGKESFLHGAVGRAPLCLRAASLGGSDWQKPGH